jgi:hypothetical protein
MTHHPDALVEAVARAVWGSDIGAGDADEVVSDGKHNWQLCTDDAKRILAAIAAQGLVVVPNASNMTDEQAEAIAMAIGCCGGIAHTAYAAALAARPGAADGQEGVGG